MTRKLIIALGLLFSFNAYSCDTKPCEKAHASATKKYTENVKRRANAKILVSKIYIKVDNKRAQTYRDERVAYSKIREKRDQAVAIKKYIKTDNKRAQTYRNERVAYSKIREKRDYALNKHLRLAQAQKTLKRHSGRNKK